VAALIVYAIHGTGAGDFLELLRDASLLLMFVGRIGSVGCPRTLHGFDCPGRAGGGRSFRVAPPNRRPSAARPAGRCGDCDTDLFGLLLLAQPQASVRSTLGRRLLAARDRFRSMVARLEPLNFRHAALMGGLLLGTVSLVLFASEGVAPAQAVVSLPLAWTLVRLPWALAGGVVFAVTRSDATASV
jgi:hypothetical protein